MNAIDIVIGLVVVLSFFYGMWRGLIMELSGLVGIALGIWGAIHFGHSVEDWLGSEYAGEYTGIVSFILLFAVICFVVHFVAAWLSRVVNIGIIGLANRLFGGAFSVIKVLLILSCICYGINYLAAQGIIPLPDDVIQQSRLYPIVSELAPALFSQLDFGSASLSEVVERQI